MAWISGEHCLERCIIEAHTMMNLVSPLSDIDLFIFHVDITCPCQTDFLISMLLFILLCHLVSSVVRILISGCSGSRWLLKSGTFRSMSRPNTTSCHIQWWADSCTIKCRTKQLWTWRTKKLIRLPDTAISRGVDKIYLESSFWRKKQFRTRCEFQYI